MTPSTETNSDTTTLLTLVLLRLLGSPSGTATRSQTHRSSRRACRRGPDRLRDVLPGLPLPVGMRSSAIRLLPAWRAARSAQGNLLEEEYDEQAQRRDRRGDEEHRMQGVGDGLPNAILHPGGHRLDRVWGCLKALGVDPRGSRRELARQPQIEPAGEDRAEESHADGATQRPEEVRGGGRDADVPAVDRVLDG